LSTPRESERQLLGIFTSWLVSLPHDLRVLLEAKDDPNLDRAARDVAAGTLVFILCCEAREKDFAEFADDIVIFRLALRAIIDKGGEGAADFRTRFEEHCATLDADLALCKEVMGDVYTWLTARMDALPRLHKNKKLALFIDDEETIAEVYEDVLAFQTDYAIDENTLAMKFKRLDTVMEPLRRRMAAEKKKIG
jgi:hypothetical protein